MHEDKYASSQKLVPGLPQFEEACRASAQKYATRCNHLGLIFHGGQAKFYESFLETDRFADAKETEADKW